MIGSQNDDSETGYRVYSTSYNHVLITLCVPHDLSGFVSEMK